MDQEKYYFTAVGLWYHILLVNNQIKIQMVYKYLETEFKQAMRIMTTDPSQKLYELDALKNNKTWLIKLFQNKWAAKFT